MPHSQRLERPCAYPTKIEFDQSQTYVQALVKKGPLCSTTEGVFVKA